MPETSGCVFVAAKPLYSGLRSSALGDARRRNTEEWLGPESNREPTDYEAVPEAPQSVSPCLTRRNLSECGVSAGVIEATESHPRVPTVSTPGLVTLERVAE